MDEGPHVWDADVVLADGGTLHLRPIRPEDAELLVALRDRMSEQSLYSRFHGAPPKLTSQRLAYFTNVDLVDRVAIVALLDDQLVAVARYDRTNVPDQAEVAFMVDDAHQGRGIAMLLLEHLAASARANGIVRFRADVLAGNRQMMNVFRAAGWHVESRLESGGVLEVLFTIDETEQSRSAMWEREHHAESASIRRLLYPRSLAVIGASREPGTIGHELFANILRGGFTGLAFPVNRSAPDVLGITAFASILDVPDPVDLAVIAVPAEAVPEVITQCATKGVTGLVIISAGFSEAATAGRETERAMVEFARSHGMRIVGPNCLGVVNTDPTVRLNATFAPFSPDPGPVGFLSQSGAFGIALLEAAVRLRLGISSFLSVGNKADVSGNDLLQYWEDDGDTGVILLYLESFGNPRKFARIARRVAKTKPIVALKGGRTSAGVRAAASHTAAAASPDIAVDALFHQAGVIRVDTVSDLFGVAQFLAFQPLPRGPRLGIVSNGGGPGILAADAAEQFGLEVPELSPATQMILRDALPEGAAVANPVDLVASATPEAYSVAVAAILADPRIDVAVVQFTPPIVTSGEDVARAIARSARSSSKPVAGVFLATSRVPEGARQALSHLNFDLPVYEFPEDAVRAVSHAVAYADWRARPEGSLPDLAGVDHAAAHGVVDDFLASQPDGGWLRPEEANRLLMAYGIPVLPTVEAADQDSAVRAAERLGFPVAMKAVGPDLVHKSDLGGVQLDIDSADGVRRAYSLMQSKLGAGATCVALQPMSAGLETIVGVVQDPAFGPLVMFGLGGVTTELLADRAFRILPVTDRDAADLVRSIRGAPLLFGYRGRPPCDVAALEDLLLRVGRLADEIPELAEMDLNPVMVSAQGARAVDVKVRVVPAPAKVPAVRRMRSP